MQNRIHLLVDEHQTELTAPNAIEDHIVGYYQGLLGVSGTRDLVDSEVVAIGPVLNTEARLVLVKEVTWAEV